MITTIMNETTRNIFNKNTNNMSTTSTSSTTTNSTETTRLLPSYHTDRTISSSTIIDDDSNNNDINNPNGMSSSSWGLISYLKKLLYVKNLSKTSKMIYTDWINYWYPNDLPDDLQVLYLYNICIPLCYLLVGTCDGMLRPMLNVYPIDLNATEEQQTLLAGIATLPAVFKLIYGFISDNTCIYGYRRKPYMYLGWLVASLSMIVLQMNSSLTMPLVSTKAALVENLSTVQQQQADSFIGYNDSNETFLRPTTYDDLDGNSQRRFRMLVDESAVWSTSNVDDLEEPISNNFTANIMQPQQHRYYDDNNNNKQNLGMLPPPSFVLLGCTFFIFGLGMWFADVMIDSLVATRVRIEPEHYRGSLQSTCYTCRFFGLMCSSPISTYLYSTNGPASIVYILTIAPLTIVPFIYYLKEEQFTTIPSMKQQCLEIWNTICSRSVWQPIGFLFIYNLLQIKNAAWKQFLKSIYHFTSSQLNALLVISYALLYFGTITYKYFLMNMNWRHLYYITISINGIFSLGQLLLITGHTFGLNPFVFAIGDDAVGDFISGIQFLPATILMVSLCPVGSEGASYAMFTTVFNAGQLLTPSLSTMLLPIWDVSKTSFEEGTNYMSGMIKLTIVTSFIQTSPLLLLGFLPSGREELIKLSNTNNDCSTFVTTPGPNCNRSVIGGIIFLLVLFGSMLYMFVVTIIKIAYADG